MTTIHDDDDDDDDDDDGDDDVNVNVDYVCVVQDRLLSRSLHNQL